MAAARALSFDSFSYHFGKCRITTRPSNTDTLLPRSKDAHLTAFSLLRQKWIESTTLKMRIIHYLHKFVEDGSIQMNDVYEVRAILSERNKSRDLSFTSSTRRGAAVIVVTPENFFLRVFDNAFKLAERTAFQFTDSSSFNFFDLLRTHVEFENFRSQTRLDDSVCKGRLASSLVHTFQLHVPSHNFGFGQLRHASFTEPVPIWTLYCTRLEERKNNLFFFCVK